MCEWEKLRDVSKNWQKQLNFVRDGKTHMKKNIYTADQTNKQTNELTNKKYNMMHAHLLTLCYYTPIYCLAFTIL